MTEPCEESIIGGARANLQATNDNRSKIIIPPKNETIRDDVHDEGRDSEPIGGETSAGDEEEANNLLTKK